MAANQNLTNKKHNLREIFNARYHGTVYDNVEYTVANGQTNNDFSAQTGAFSNIKTAHFVSFRTDVTVTVRFNATANAAITVTSTDSPLEIDRIEVTNIYVTNASGSTANIKILLV